MQYVQNALPHNIKLLTQNIYKVIYMLCITVIPKLMLYRRHDNVAVYFIHTSHIPGKKDRLTQSDL